MAWFAGVDWGSEKHQACLLDGHGSIAGEREFPHGGVGLAELVDWLISIAGVAAQRDPKCRARYAALRQRGYSHGRAPRGVADRLLGLACVLLQ